MKRLAIILLLILWPFPVLATDSEAKVVGVSDRDTITVLTPEKRQDKVRLHGIDAPERGRNITSKFGPILSATSLLNDAARNAIELCPIQP